MSEDAAATQKASGSTKVEDFQTKAKEASKLQTQTSKD